MKNTVMVIIIFLFLLAACDNGSYSPEEDKLYTGTFIYSAEESGIPWYLGWQWIKEDNDPDLEFKWIFKNDGTISVIHCCDAEFPDQFSYIFCGNVLVTYGSEMSSDTVESAAFTKNEDDNGVSSFTRNGITFIRGDPDTGSSSSSPIVLSNNLLGTWQGDNGKVYQFSPDAGLQINPSSGSGQYGYLVRKNKLLTIGPLVNGTTATILEYTFTRPGSVLNLARQGAAITLSRPQ